MGFSHGAELRSRESTNESTNASQIYDQVVTSQIIDVSDQHYDGAHFMNRENICKGPYINHLWPAGGM